MTYLEFISELKSNYTSWFDIKISHNRGGLYNEWLWDGKVFSLGDMTIGNDQVFDSGQVNANTGTFHNIQPVTHLVFQRVDHTLEWSEEDGITVTHHNGYKMVPSDADVSFIKDQLGE